MAISGVFVIKLINVSKGPGFGSQNVCNIHNCAPFVHEPGAVQRVAFLGFARWICQGAHLGWQIITHVVTDMIILVVTSNIILFDNLDCKSQNLDIPSALTI
jgi:hypothetical protein